MIASKLKKSFHRKTKLHDEDKVDDNSTIINFLDYFQEYSNSEVVNNWSSADD